MATRESAHLLTYRRQIEMDTPNGYAHISQTDASIFNWLDLCYFFFVFFSSLVSGLLSCRQHINSISTAARWDWMRWRTICDRPSSTIYTILAVSKIHACHHSFSTRPIRLIQSHFQSNIYWLPSFTIRCVYHHFIYILCKLFLKIGWSVSFFSQKGRKKNSKQKFTMRYSHETSIERIIIQIIIL